MAIRSDAVMKKKERRRVKRQLKQFMRELCGENKDLILNVHAGSKISTTELVNKIFDFCQLYSGITFYPYQEQFSKRVIRSVLENDGAEITALFSRQSGKSETIATTVGGLMIILPKLANMPMFAGDKRLEMFKDGMWIGIFAPSQRQAQITYNRIRQRIQSRNAQVILHDPDFNLEFTTSNGQTVALSNGSFASAISASDNTNIEGESFKFIICEEAQDISDFKILKCLTGDTRVLLDDGSYISIKELVENKLPKNVVYFDENFERQKSSIPLEFYDNGVQPVYKIRLSNGDSIKATLNHQFLVFAEGDKRPYWRTLEEIIERNKSKNKYRMAVPDRLPYFGEEEPFDYEKGLIMGYFMGDGCFSEDTPLFIGDELTVLRLLEKIRLVFGEYMTMSVYEFNRESGMYQVAYVPNDNKGSNPLIEWFRQEKVWGLRSNEKCLRDDKVYSQEFYKGFIEGLIETDGCIESYKAEPVISFASISERLVRQVKDIYLKFGIHTTYFVKDNGNIGEYSSKNLHLLHIKSSLDIKRFAENFTLFRKTMYLNEALETIKNDKETRNKYPNSLRFYQITDIEYVGEEHTYCLKMPNRNFIANNMVSSNSIHPMGAAYNATIVKIGTATTHKGNFYECIQRNKRDYKEGRSRYQNHFEYDYRVVMKYNPRYKEYVEKEKYRLGEFSDEFRMSYGLEWILERGLFIGDINKFIETCGDARLDRVFHDTTKNHVVGIDVGKMHDSTVVTVGEVDWEKPILLEESQSEDASVGDFVAYEVVVKDWLELQGDDFNEQYYRIIDYLKNFNVSKICIDATAEGSFADRLKANLPYQVDSIVFSIPTKSAMYKHLDREIKAGRVKFPASDRTRQTREYNKFIEQMGELVKEYRGQHMVVSHPAERGAHDDYADSLALMVWAAKEESQLRPVDVQLENTFFRPEVKNYYQRRNSLTAKRR